MICGIVSGDDTPELISLFSTPGRGSQLPVATDDLENCQGNVNWSGPSMSILVLEKPEGNGLTNFPTTVVTNNEAEINE